MPRPPRGFRNDGSSRTSAQGLPLTWGPKQGVAWRASLPGSGQSSPVVWRGRVYVMAVRGKDKEKCLVLAQGRLDRQVALEKGVRGQPEGAQRPQPEPGRADA